MCFGSASAIGGDTARVGIGSHGSTTKLKQIEETFEKGNMNMQYLGVVFDGTQQLGLAAFTIEVAIAATPAAPPITHDAEAHFQLLVTVTGIFDVLLSNAKKAALAYQPYSIVQQQLPIQFQLTPVKQIHDLTTDTNGYIASNDKQIFVVFTGSKSIRNWLTNIKFLQSPATSGGPMVHRGFINALTTVYSSIEKEIAPYAGKKEINFVGHSLGGALASLAAYAFVSKYNVKVNLYVYGCPTVGDIIFSRFFTNTTKVNSHVVTMTHDIISSGLGLAFGNWLGLYKPSGVMMLIGSGHGINYYIKALQDMK